MTERPFTASTITDEALDHLYAMLDQIKGIAGAAALGMLPVTDWKTRAEQAEHQIELLTAVDAGRAEGARRLQRRAEKAERVLARIRDASQWADVWSTLGMHYGWTAEKAGLRARALRKADAQAAHNRAEKAEAYGETLLNRAQTAEAALARVHHDAVRAITAWHSARTRANTHRAKLDAGRELADLYRQKIRNLKADLLDAEELLRIAHETSNRSEAERARASGDAKDWLTACETARDQRDKAEERAAAAEARLTMVATLAADASAAGLPVHPSVLLTVLDGTTPAHSCGNCAGINPGTCPMNPDRTAPAPAATTEPTDRQPAYDAVFAYIREQPCDFLPTTIVARNAMIWRAVGVALDAVTPAATEATEDQQVDEEPTRCTCGDAGDAFVPLGHYRDCPEATEATEDTAPSTAVVVNTGGPFVEYVPGPPAPVVVTDREAIRNTLDADTDEPPLPDHIEITKYQRSRGGTAWAMRCWRCGVLALDLGGEQAAERVARRHLADYHAEDRASESDDTEAAVAAAATPCEHCGHALYWHPEEGACMVTMTALGCACPRFRPPAEATP